MIELDYKGLCYEKQTLYDNHQDPEGSSHIKYKTLGLPITSWFYWFCFQNICL